MDNNTRGVGTTIHAWLKLVIDRMPEPLVNMGTEKTAADRVKMRGGTLTTRHYGIVPNWTEKGMELDRLPKPQSIHSNFKSEK